MSIKINDYELKYEIDESKKGKVILLPKSINTDFKGTNSFIYQDTTLNVIKLLKQEEIQNDIGYGTMEHAVFHENRSHDWFGPIFLITGKLITENPMIISVIINLISSYIYDSFKVGKKEPNAKCSFVYHETAKTKKIDYDGPVSGLKEISEIIEKIRNE